MVIKRNFWISLFLMVPLLCLSATEKSQEMQGTSSFTPFTGMVSHQRVRLRAEPTTDSIIIREAGKGDLFLVVDETDDFFAVSPPKGTQVYVYRTFVVEDTVEGDRVNVRLAPSIDSPVVAQLNTGAKVTGNLCKSNPKWVEITPPDSVRFFIAKDFIEKVGDAGYLTKQEKRALEAEYLVQTAEKMSKEELEKSFQDIQLEEAQGFCEKVIMDYSDFPSYVSQAKKLSQLMQQNYLQKKIAHLEERLKGQQTTKEESDGLQKEIHFHQEKLQEVAQQLHTEQEAQEDVPMAIEPTPTKTQGREVTSRMSHWLPQEEQYFEQWRSQQDDYEQLSRNDFYQSQHHDAVVLKGVIQPFSKSVHNKPGDFLLLSPFNNSPSAYLYSTQINLENYIGKEVTLIGVERPNNYFAFDAYFILGVEE